MSGPETDSTTEIEAIAIDTAVLSPTPRQNGDAPTADTLTGEAGEAGKKVRKKLVLEGPEVAEARIKLINSAPVFDGLRDPATIAKLVDNIKFFDNQRSGRLLFDASDSSNGLGRENNILITGKATSIKVSLPDGSVITEGTEIPAHTAMGERGFLGQERTATVHSLTEDGVFWRLEGPIESLGLSTKEQLTLRANLLAARGGEISAINREISHESRTDIIGVPELKTMMAELIGTLGIVDVRDEYIKVVPGHFFYLESGALQVVDDSGKVLGLVKGPNIVQELIGAGLSAQTAKLKPYGVVKGAHVPCRKLIEVEHPQAQNMLALAEAAFNSKMATGNEAVAAARPEPTSFDNALNWARNFFKRG